MFTDLNTWESVEFWRVGGGALLGILFGVLVQRSRFCMLAVVTNLVMLRDFRQLHAYVAAVAVAIAGAQLIEATGTVELAASSYRNARFDWAGALAGGLIFGFGTVLAGGCVGRTLVRAAEGSLGAWLVLCVCALSAAATISGPLAPLRLWLVENTAVQIPGGGVALTELPGLSRGYIIVLVTVTALAIIAFVGRTTRSAAFIAAGVALGALAVAGWWITGRLGQDEFSLAIARPVSLGFAGPMAQMVIATGGGGAYFPFGTALLAGVLLGSGASALWTRTFHWVLPQGTQLVRLMVGAGLMGAGAMLAGGCNIGLGLSGLSTCSMSAILAVAAIFLGMRLGLVWLQYAESASPPVPAHA